MSAEPRDVDAGASARVDAARDYARLLADTASLIVVGLDASGRVTMWNRAAEVATGWAAAEIVGEKWTERCVPEGRGGAWDALAEASAGGAMPTQSESAIVARSGAERLVEWQHGAFEVQGEHLGTISFGIDVTERKRAESAMRDAEGRMQNAERLAALGTLAGGMAHEINNPLAYVKLNLSLVERLLDRLAREDDRPTRAALAATLRERIAEAQQGTSRVAEVVHGLQAFSRPETDGALEVDVRRVLESAIERASNEVRHRARLVRDLRETPLVLADRDQLAAAFWHLLVNAAQAIPEGDAEHHEIRVSTSTDAQGRAVVRVSDTGGGISPKAAPRIFEPFFTTRPVGSGLGLGLSVCHGVVSALGGTISAVAREGAGTTFEIVLPPAPERRWAAQQAVTPPPPTARPRARVLVVDDEPALLGAFAALLSESHEVVTAESGRDALARIRENDRFDAIFCDLMMPDVGGIELYETLTAEKPELARALVFMTGGAFTRRAHEFLLAVPNPKLEKPLDLARIEEIVASRRSSP